MGNLTEMIGGLVIITGAVLIVYIITKYNYLIKKSMVDKGLSFSNQKDEYRYLNLGCTALGAGVGLLVSSFFTTMDLTEDTMDLMVWGTLLVFGAIGALLGYFARRKIEKSSKS